MGTCNTISWQVVVPTVTFRSEVWICSEKDDELLLNVQCYAGRKVQRFPQRPANASSFYGLGWLKLTSYVKVKKLLFILSILRMKPHNVLRRAFETRFSEFDCNTEICRKNKFRSPIFDILDDALVFGLSNAVKETALSRYPVATKRAWSKLIWEHAWMLKDANWKASNTILKENDLWTLTVGNALFVMVEN